MKCRYISFFLCIMLTAGSAIATTLEDVMKLVQAADKNITTLQFGYRQEISYTLTNEKQVNTGTVSFLKPDSLYLTQTKPLEQTIVADGKKVWIYTPSYKQVIEDDWKKWANNSMVPASLVNFGKGWDDLKKQYTFSYMGSEGTDYILSLTPAAGKKNNLFEIMLWINSASGMPVRIVLKGENVSVTTQIMDQKINPTLDKKIFKFTAPPGVESLKIN